MATGPGGLRTDYHFIYGTETRSPRKIDVWTHILTQAYVRHLEKAESVASGASSFLLANRALHDLQYRFKVMDAYEDYRQVLTPMPGPHIYVQQGSRDKIQPTSSGQ